MTSTNKELRQMLAHMASLLWVALCRILLIIVLFWTCSCILLAFSTRLLLTTSFSQVQEADGEGEEERGWGINEERVDSAAV